MLQIISISDYCNNLFHIPVIDVRSPAEFQQGHVPNANNIPLFSNEERAIVGTVYKQQSKEKAIEIGCQLVEPKLDFFLKECTIKKTKDGIVIHCWRGGMRSQSFAEHLVKNGFKNVYLIQGGYKTFRTLVLQTFSENYSLTILGGYTGSGKTEILHELEKMGEQVIDLEGLAKHKGSAFGGFEHQQQPTSEQFENTIYWEMKDFELSKPIWIEDESRNIGNALLPADLYKNMKEQHTVFIDIPRNKRAEFLVEGYSHYSHEDLADAIKRITKKIGGLNSQIALEALSNNNYHLVVEMILHYYDKRYLIGLNKRKENQITRIKLEQTNHKENAKILLHNNIQMNDTIKLTQYSHGAGCGCKISPKLLTEMLKTDIPSTPDARLLVGNSSRDDAAVYDMENGTAIISTTDFFMPIVDDPFTFGKIAAANAISDIYAMGGSPLLAIAILGWPIDKLSPEVAREVLEGGRAACKDAGILLAGGHSIDSPEPIFGLAVTGTVEINKLKRNDTAKEGCRLYLTKPLGVGILTTAQKKGFLKEGDAEIGPNSMMQLNKIGQKLAEINGVTAMTDVTGFGLLGHLTEMCEGSKLSAKIDFNKVPKLEVLDYYLEKGSIPGGTNRNWASYGHNILLSEDSQKNILCDPQTSGGLLIAVQPDSCHEVEILLQKNNIKAVPFGELTTQTNRLIIVI